MKSYQKIEDFLEDQSFKQWVLHDDPVQEAYWQDWLAANPSHAETAAHAKRILLEMNSVGKGWNAEREKRLFSNITRRINAQVKTKAPHYAPYQPASSAIGKRVAALIFAFLLMVSSGALLQEYLLEGNEGSLLVEQAQEEWVTKSNPKGQKSTLQLADGSKVFLNAASEIRYGSGFGQRHRDIYLEGEAFFEVASDSLLPFKVHSGELVTIALGTSFNINSYKKGEVQVQLATGKVKVHQEARENHPVYLTPGEEVVLGPDHKLNKGKFDPDKAFRWKNGILLFEKTDFQEVVAALERWYAVEVKVNNLPSGDINISGEFKNTYLKDVLESLGYAYGFEYGINKKEVVIHFRTHD